MQIENKILKKSKPPKKSYKKSQNLSATQKNSVISASLLFLSVSGKPLSSNSDSIFLVKCWEVDERRGREEYGEGRGFGLRIGNERFLAHVRRDGQEHWILHSLEEYLREVAD